MNLNPLNSIVLAGIIQGLILSIFILSSKKNRTRSAIYLGLLILSFSLSNLQYSLEEMEIISWEVFNNIYIPYFFLVPPFLYFFVMHFLYPERKTKSKEKILYAPFVVLLSLTGIYKIIGGFIPRTEVTEGIMEEISFFIDVYGDFINIPIIFFVLIALLFRIKQYSNKHKNFDTKKVKIQLLWLNVFLLILLVTIIPWLYSTIVFIQDSELLFIPLYTLASVVIYLIGYIGIHKIGINIERKNIKRYNETRQNYSITEKRQNEHITALETILIDKKQFLDSTLSLDSIASELNISKGHLSRVINSELNTSFSDYVNSLRVEEAKSYLLNPAFSNYTLVAIGLEAGFNSKSTFNGAFKKVTGSTPSQFKKTRLN